MKFHFMLDIEKHDRSKNSQTFLLIKDEHVYYCLHEIPHLVVNVFSIVYFHCSFHRPSGFPSQG